MTNDQKVNILLVDDHPENLLALEAILESLGQNLVKATSGEEALKCLLDKDFAVIMLDVQMPGMDGFETAELIRLRPKNQQTPIIFLTAFHKNEQFMFKGYAVGAVDYMIKPLTPEILKSKVSVFINIFKKNAQIKQQKELVESTNLELQNEIKKHRRTTKLLEIKQGEFEAIFESIPDAVILADLNLKIMMCNPAFTNLFGYESQEAINQEYQMIWKKNKISLTTVLNNIDNLRSYEMVYFRKNGEKFIGDTINTLVKDADGNTIGLLGIIRDITEQKRAEEEIAMLNHQKSLILQSAGEGIYGVNREGETTFINPVAAKMLGYEQSELIGEPMHSLLHHSKADGTDYPLEECPVYKSLKDGTIHHITNEVFWRKNGSSFPVEYVSTPIQEQGEIVGAVITFKDITERQAIEQIKNEFIAVVSHELRTPLTAIHGALNLLSSGLVDANSEKGRRVIAIAEENSDRLVRIVNDILDLERLQSGKMGLSKQPCNAADLMVKAIDSMQEMANRSKVTLSVSPQSIRLNVDSDRILQVLTNLLSNAIKFSPQGATVWLTVEQRGDLEQRSTGVSPVGAGEQVSRGEKSTVLFQVKDQGRGIPAEKIDTIFERFHQVDASDSRKQGGTGLGLAICRSIVQQHGGEIWVESRVGEGSNFYFTLPQ
ncbi:hybrid sensor histidine kinase/response regulator [Microseira wollei]|nr:PAS domain S-box protein [Microseira wollei]